MTLKSIQDILPLVEMPSRYLGTEINRVKKRSIDVDLQIALAFPDLYEIGSSHFGIQILYHLLNQHPNIAAERIFAPAADMEKLLRIHSMELFSLESQRSAKEFNILGFSLLYELTYTNVLNMLQLSGIPFLSSQRDLSYPIVIAGGPCTCNPEPMADVFDAMVIGDGEQVLMNMCEIWLKWHKTISHTKDGLLENWATIEGVYVPKFFNDSPYTTSFSQDGMKKKVKRAVVNDLDNTYFPPKPLIPFGKPIHDRLRLEVSRGCSRGCRFCQAGMIYRPVRERRPDNLVTMANETLTATGYEDLSLLSLSTGDYGCINALMNTLMQTCENEHVAISLPSLRAGTLSPELMKQIKKVRKTGFTIAPEAGSQRLRDVINKNITEEDIIKTVHLAFEMGWQVIKLYFMVGLPTETKEDLDAIVTLVRKLRNLKGFRDRRRKINVSVNTFIPKAHTPFQWVPQISRERSWEIISYLKEKLNIKGVHFKWQNPDVSLIEGVMARGSRKLLPSIIVAYNNGCKFDGWDDYFDFEKWQQSFEKTGIDLTEFINRPLEPESQLVWDHIDIGIEKDFFLLEWQKAINKNFTNDCRWNGCKDCGVCDFSELSPIVYGQDSYLKDEIVRQQVDTGKPTVYQKLFVTYSKKDEARFLGHLEMVKVFHRALKRAGIKPDFSKGFHPMPKVAFEDPLPIGIESDCEHFVISMSTDFAVKDFQKKLNEQLPKGLWIVSAKIKGHSHKKKVKQTVTYQITIKDGFFDQNRLHSFYKKDEWILKRTTRKGLLKIIDLKKTMPFAQIEASNRLIIHLLEECGKIVRPMEILEKIFGFQNEMAKLARVLKLSVQDE